MVSLNRIFLLLSKERRRYAQLRHNDLPMASGAEYIPYDPAEEYVEITGSPPEFNTTISVAEIIERPRRSP